MENKTILYGNENKRPPFLHSFTTSPRCSDGKTERDVVIVFVVYLRDREAFVASLPKILAADSIAQLIPAEEIERRGLVSANYTGLELASVVDAEDGVLRILTVTYSTPSDGEQTTDPDDMSDADAKWWTSEASGKVYHERKKIKVADSEKYSEYALQPKYGLAPNGNGASISPRAGEIMTTAEASWGPEEEEDPEPDEEGDGWHLGGNQAPKPTGSMVSVISTEAVQLSHLDIAKSLGLWNNVMAEHGTGALDELCALLESGAVVPGKDFRTGQACYLYNSPDSSVKEVWTDTHNGFNGVVPPISQAMQYAKAVAANPVVIVPCTTMTITFEQKTVTVEDLTNTDTAAGQKLETTDGQGNKTPAPITEGGVNIPPPHYDFEDPKYADIPTVTFWQFCGRSTDSMKIKTRYKMGKKYTFKKVVFTSTYRSVTKSALRYLKQPD